MNEKDNLIEKALLGLIILKPNLISKIVGILNPNSFIDSNLREIFITLEELFNNKSEIDSLIIVNNLSLRTKKPKEFWVDLLAELTISSGYESNIGRYIEILSDKNQSRELEKTLNLSLKEND